MRGGWREETDGDKAALTEFGSVGFDKRKRWRVMGSRCSLCGAFLRTRRLGECGAFSSMTQAIHSVDSGRQLTALAQRPVTKRNKLTFDGNRSAIRSPLRSGIKCENMESRKIRNSSETAASSVQSSLIAPLRKKTIIQILRESIDYYTALCRKN